MNIDDEKHDNQNELNISRLPLDYQSTMCYNDSAVVAIEKGWQIYMKTLKIITLEEPIVPLVFINGRRIF